MPDDIVRWRAANGRTGQFRRTGGRNRRRPATVPVPVRAVRAAAIPPTPPLSGLAALRARLGLPATATDEQVVAATIAALPASAPPSTAPVAAVVPLAVAPAPVASGPTAEQLAEEAEFEALNHRLFGLPLGPASAALAERGLPSPAERRSDVAAARETAWLAEFNRNQEAARRAGELEVDAARAGRGRVAAEDRVMRERLQDQALFPELRP